MKDATVVPVAAIQRGQPGTFVYLVKADDTVEIRVVELGVTDGEKVQIVKGLQPGDQVVIDGTDRLRDGAKIRRPGRPRRARGDVGPAGRRRAAGWQPARSATPQADADGSARRRAPGRQRRRRRRRRRGRPAQPNQ